MLKSTAIIVGIFAIISFSLASVVSGQTTNDDSIIIEGNYNLAERIFANGTRVFEEYLFVDEDNKIKKYRLFSETSTKNMFDMSGKRVQVKGDLLSNNNQKRMPFDNYQMIKVRELVSHTSNEVSRSLNEVSTSSNNSNKRLLPASFQVEVLLTNVTDACNLAGCHYDELHNQAYFQDRYFNTATDSLTEFWDAASYGQFSWDGTVQPYRFLTNSTDDYGGLLIPNDIDLAIDSVNLHDDFVDYTNVDQIMFIFNTCTGFALAYFGTFPFETDEGTQDMYVTEIYDCGDGFPAGINFERGIGVTAHEMGHNFGWDHTQQFPPEGGNPPYDDEWSVMSGGGADGPPGVIAYHRVDAGWIDSSDIITIPEGTTRLVTLDFLNNTSPGSGYLVANVTFGVNDHYYTVEARRDSTLDGTPQDQTGAMIYHFSPTGHGVTVAEPSSPILLVTADGRGGGVNPEFDFDNADLDVGQTFTENGVRFESKAVSSTSIVVQIFNNAVPCSIPSGIDWTITSSCTLMSSGTADRNITVQNNSVLTIPQGVTLNFNFINFSLTIKSGSGVLILSGGTIT